MTHAFFKALLFLAAGSVIIGMHHDQDIRNMGGLRKYMPITWITSLLGSLALIGTPLFSGFYSKDCIIEAVHASNLPGSGLRLLRGRGRRVRHRVLFVPHVLPGLPRQGALPPQAVPAGGRPRRARRRRTATTTRRTPSRAPTTTPARRTSRPWVVTLPLVLLAIPSVVIGFLTIGPMLFGDFFKDSIVVVAGAHPAMAELAREFHGPVAMALHGLTDPVVLAGARRRRRSPGSSTCSGPTSRRRSSAASRLRLPRCSTTSTTWTGSTRTSCARRARLLGTGLWKGGDVGVIDGILINGSARTRRRPRPRRRGALQTGYLYWYALVMIVGVIGLMTWQLWPYLGGLFGR